MSNLEKSKPIPQEAIDSLPDGYTLLGWGGDFKCPNGDECVFGAAFSPEHWTGWEVDGPDEDEPWAMDDHTLIFAASTDSEIVRLNQPWPASDIHDEVCAEGLDDDAPTTKPTNPKDSCGVKKAPIHGLPVPVIFEAGLVKLHGDMKYGEYNWRDAGVRGSVYYDAAFRHLAAWWEGEDLDPDSGVHHLSHAICGLMVLRDAQMRNNWTDDRPKPTIGFLADMNHVAEEIITK